MLGEVLKIGDEVIITIPQENSEWGYNPCPDGTKARVVGFSEISYGRIQTFGLAPGYYVNYAWVKLVLEDGRDHTELAGRLELTDPEEYDRRLEAFRAEQGKGPHSRETFVRELPDTPFWEGDTVLVYARSRLTVVTSEFPENEPQLHVVVGIGYDHLSEQTQVGTKWPAYRISDKMGSGWYTSASEDDMELVERGNVWRFYHHLPLRFADIKEEANFFHMIGHSEEVRNPENNLYSWTKEEVLVAIRNGVAHSMRVSHGLFGSAPRVVAYKFRDEDLGRRVAQITLEGFDEVA